MHKFFAYRLRTYASDLANQIPFVMTFELQGQKNPNPKLNNKPNYLKIAKTVWQNLRGN